MKINQWIPAASSNRYTKVPRELMEREVRVISQHENSRTGRIESAAQFVDAMEADGAIKNRSRSGTHGKKRFGHCDDFEALAVLSGPTDELTADFQGPTFVMTFADLIRHAARKGYGLIVIEDKYCFFE